MRLIDDVLEGNGCVAMLQPRDETAPLTPLTDDKLYDVGCLGSLEQCRPRASGKGYAVLIKGVLRFHRVEVTETDRGYRQVKTDYTPFLSDLDEPWDEADFSQVRRELQRRIEAKKIAFDMSILGQVPGADIVNGLSQVFPFSMAERQALLEAPSVRDRQNVLLNLMRMGISRLESSRPSLTH